MRAANAKVIQIPVHTSMLLVDEVGGNRVLNDEICVPITKREEIPMMIRPVAAPSTSSQNDNQDTMTILFEGTTKF